MFELGCPATAPVISAVDASLMVADVNKQRSILGSEWQKTSGGGEAQRFATKLRPA
jgi:hypothetical protein